MKAGIWYEVDERLPPQSGYYLAFKGFSMGDNEPNTGYYYWDAKKCEWKDSGTSQGRYSNVVYWTESDPEGWYEKYNMRRRDEISAAEKDAWAAVERAIEQYDIVRKLSSK